MKNFSLPNTLPSFFWYFIKKQWLGLSVLLITMFAWAIQESVYPYFIKLIIDAVTEHAGQKEIIFSLIGALLIKAALVVITLEILFRIHDYVGVRVMPNFRANIKTAMFEHVQYHSYKYFADHFAGSLAARISRMSEGIEEIVTLSITIFVPIVVSFLISSTLLFMAKPIFAVMILSWFCIHMFITFMFTSKCSYYSSRHSKQVTMLHGKIVDCLSNIMNVRLFARYKFEKDYFLKNQQKEIDTAQDSLFYNAVMKTVLSFTGAVFIFLMVGLGIYFWQKDVITLAELALILSYQNLLGLMWYMGMNLIYLYDVIGNCKEALSLINKPYEIVDKEDARELYVTDGKIEFNKVTFKYARNKNIFADASIVIPPKQKVGLVGFSGSGKTTFVNLILRYFEIESGEILIDGQNIADVTQESLRSQIGVIPQDSILFHRTIMENIRYGRLDATDEEVIEAAKKAHAHQFITNLPDGYNSHVGERGAKLSGGQRQRISIARAILKNAPILILDEATSALDSVTEKYIQDSLHELMQGKTVIVIAHRLSTLLDMDRILVFSRGHIVEDGTHKELLAKKGHYFRLWEMQTGEFLPMSDNKRVTL
jgi:ATP-binding cassette subfamily B protein